MTDKRNVENAHPKSVVDWITAIDLGDTIVTAPSTLLNSCGASTFSLELAKVKDLNGCILRWKNGHLSFDFKYNKFKVSIVSKSHSCHFSILHLQILLFMLSTNDGAINDYWIGRLTNSLQTQIKLVLDNGGSTGLEIRSVAVCIKQNNSSPKHLEITSATSLQFIFSLIKARPGLWYHTDFNRFHQNVTNLVDMIEKPNSILGVHEGSEPLRNPPHYRSHLLYLKELSDVTFVCNDGTTIPAHKIILAGASPYFRTFFAGPWDQQNPDGNWKTEFDADILKIVLRYIYEWKMHEDPGSMNVEVLLKVLQIGQEFQMSDLVDNCCKILRTKINVDNIKSIICVAWTVVPPIAGSTNLWKHCIDFIKERLNDFFFNPEFCALASEHQDLWRDLQREISSKRARISSD